MKGRIWLVIGAVVGVAIAIGDVKYLAGAARSLADDAQRLVASGGSGLVRSVARHGAPQRLVTALTFLLAILVPGIAAFLLVLAARGSLRLRAVVAMLISVVGVASFAYQSGGHAAGVILLALVIAVVAVAVTGPLVAAPLCALAGLIGGEFLPRVLSSPAALPNAPAQQLYRAMVNHSQGGAPTWFRVLLLVVAVAPFAAGIRLIVKR
ncbi:MAG: hypothetical protein ACRDY0_06020 [Acidimicrobiales bacterium]